MSKIKVICTSTGCLEYAPERYRNLGIGIIRIRLNFEGKEYFEGLDLDPVDMYAKLATVTDVKGNLPSTAIPTHEEVAGAYQKAIDEGYDEVIMVCLDSYLGAMNSRTNLRSTSSIPRSLPSQKASLPLRRKNSSIKA